MKAKYDAASRWAKGWRNVHSLPGFSGTPKDGGKANKKAARRGGKSKDRTEKE